MRRARRRRAQARARARLGRGRPSRSRAAPQPPRQIPAAVAEEVERLSGRYERVGGLRRLRHLRELDRALAAAGIARLRASTATSCRARRGARGARGGARHLLPDRLPRPHVRAHGHEGARPRPPPRAPRRLLRQLHPRALARPAADARDTLGGRARGGRPRPAARGARGRRRRPGARAGTLVTPLRIDRGLALRLRDRRRRLGGQRAREPALGGPGTSVLVLEAGRSDYPWDVFIHMPAALAFPIGSRFYDWKYESEPEPYMGGRRVYHARGRCSAGRARSTG